MTYKKHTVIMVSESAGSTLGSEKKGITLAETIRSSNKIHKNLIHKHHGRLIREQGEKKLASFDLSSDAVRCAAEIQRTIRELDIPLRIVIHKGEMVFDSYEVTGKGVRVALTLLNEGKNKCITISERIYKEVKNKRGFSAVFKGNKTLEGIEEPIKVFQVKCYASKERFAEDNKKIPHWRKHKIPYLVIAIMLLILLIAFFWSWLNLPSRGSGGSACRSPDNRHLAQASVVAVDYSRNEQPV